jgi:two-component system, OmpR family, response regulator
MSNLRTPDSAYSPTLIVDADAAAAAALARELGDRGLPADTAAHCAAAQAAARARYYGSVVFVADLNSAADVACLKTLRRRLPQTWIVLISPRAPNAARAAALRHSVDALLVAPFSLADLIFRLSAFSVRPRPP